MSTSLFRPSIKRRDMDAVLTCLVEDKLTSGLAAEELSRAVCEFCGAYKGIALREMYRAVEILFEVLNAKEIGTIIGTPLMSTVYVQVAEKMGVTIHYVDVHPEKGVIVPESVASLEGLDVAAIIADYTLGMSPDVEALKSLGVPVVEDITLAFGSAVQGEKAGSFGDYIIIGTEENDILTCGGGAMLLAGEKAQWTGLKQYISKFSTKMLMSDMNASLGLSQLKELPGFIEKKNEIFEIFRRSLARGSHNTFPVAEDDVVVLPLFPVQMEKGLKDAQNYAKKKGIETELAYKNTAIEGLEDPGQYGKSYALYLRTLGFPLYASLSRKEVEVTAKVLTTLP